MAQAQAKKKASTSDKRDRSLSYKDVQILFLTDGINRVEKLFNGGMISPQSLKRAAEEMREKRDAQVLVDFATAKVGGEANGRRGRRLPVANETRTYSVQQIKDGAPFLHLPVSPLAKKKKQKLFVTFRENEIVVRAVS